MQFLDDLIQLIDISIKDDAQVLITAGDIIKDAYSPEIDAYREILTKGHIWIQEYQKQLITETGIASLKIKYTNNFGYFIEIPKTQAAKIPDYFTPRQSLLQAYRYTTESLQEFEQKLTEANSQLAEKEYTLFVELRNTILYQFDNIYTLSRKIAHLDFLANAAYISKQGGYCQVQMHQEYGVDIQAGKHPVLSLREKDFISNDLHISKSENIHVITGPNMGGKSTFLRQNALLVLMAHIGYDVPCISAKIGIVDKIFSRVGSGDNIFLGQSTFMVEMQEMSYILRNATEKSFVIIDEIGRGTSTYDGMALAWAILQHNHDTIKAKMLFATHYHEILDHAKELKRVKNFSVAVGENQDNIVFLRKIIPGGMKKSYGIEVAKLAGVPEKVLRLAQDMMQKFEQGKHTTQLSFTLEPSVYTFIGAEQEQYKKLRSSILSLDINQLTPFQALSFVNEIQKQVKNQE